jgi:glycosyltransferase involved in cell wall biosynthesis
MNPKVTVITTSYNQADYIGECIESLINQTFQEWEQIIVDDGSNDNTIDIIHYYKKQDKRIRLIQKEHGGIEKLADSYNLALQKSRGEYIAILEADDLAVPDRLERSVWHFNYKDTVLVYGKAQEFGVSSKIIPEKRIDLLPEEYMLKEMFLGCHIPALTVMVRKDILIHTGGFKTYKNLGGVDYATWLSLLPYGEFIFLNTTISKWRKHGDNLSSQQSNKIKEVFDCGYHYYKTMPKEFKKKVGLSDTQMYVVNRYRLLRSLIIYYKGRCAK